LDIKVICHPEYYIASDSFEGGCEASYMIAEDEMMSDVLWRHNAGMAWKCKYCHTYHVLCD